MHILVHNHQTHILEMQYEIRVQIKVAMEATNFGNSVTKAKIYVAVNEIMCNSIRVLTKVSILITNINKLSLSEL